MSYVYSKIVKSVCLQQLSAVNCSVQQYLSGVFSLGSRYVSAKSIQTVSHCRLRWFQWSAHRLPPNFPRPSVYLSWKHNPQNQSISMSTAWFVKTTGQRPQWVACPLPGGRQQGISGKIFQKNKKCLVPMFWGARPGEEPWTYLQASFRLEVLLHGLVRCSPEYWKQLMLRGLIYTFTKLEGKREKRAPPERRDELG